MKQTDNQNQQPQLPGGKESPEADVGKVELIKPESGTIEIIPFGTDERIRLTVKMVKNQIAVATKSGKEPTDSDCIKFMMLCRARHLNPWEGDAYLIGYDTQNGPKFSLITAHQVFLKRAEASKGFRGMQSGVILKLKDGSILEREGDLVMHEEQLLGGWAKVYRKELEFPLYKRLKFETYNTNRSRWEKDGPGMIVKCAEADALRTAFPTHLGGLYIEEEQPTIDVKAEPVPIPIERPVIETPTRRGKKKEKDPEPQNEATEKPKEEALPKKKLNLQPEDRSTEQPDAGPNELKTLTRLKELNRTKEDYVAVLRRFDGLDANQGWEHMDERKFEIMLHPDNWKLIEEAFAR